MLLSLYSASFCLFLEDKTQNEACHVTEKSQCSKTCRKMKENVLTNKTQAFNRAVVRKIVLLISVECVSIRSHDSDGETGTDRNKLFLHCYMQFFLLHVLITADISLPCSIDVNSRSEVTL